MRPNPSHVTPNQAAIRNYYSQLQDLRSQGVTNELSIRQPFLTLLAETARPVGWQVIPELGKKAGARTIRPDATLRDRNSLPRGYWEAKDTYDDLEVEIRKKRDSGYPFSNIVFEDSTRAVLFQNKERAFDAVLGNPAELADLLNRFYSHEEPDYARLDDAMAEFELRIPDLALGLQHKITEAHAGNPRFQQAWGAFFDLCKLSLNPAISKATVDEMLVQHLLTERLIREIFRNPEFARKNAVARELENVVSALTYKSFSRDEYLKSLDFFFLAIERAARTVPDFTDKQELLNKVYERFFQGYSRRTADTHGIVYTPQPIVDFMCASVERVLRDDFGLALGSPEVNVLDPCTGTGNFIVNLLRRIPRRDLPRAFGEHLFANEVMLLPYYIAALNIEHEYYELTGTYEEFSGLCFADTLDLAEARQMPMFTEENTERVKRQKDAQITVILGNPPYNMGQQDENEENKNRKYAVVDQRVKDTYVKDSKATLRNKLFDPLCYGQHNGSSVALMVMWVSRLISPVLRCPRAGCAT